MVFLRKSWNFFFWNFYSLAKSENINNLKNDWISDILDVYTFIVVYTKYSTTKNDMV